MRWKWLAPAGTTFYLSGHRVPGKTMLAKRIPTILPPMTLEEAIETTRIHSVAGNVGRPPWPGWHAAVSFAAPHHQRRGIDWRRGGAASGRSFAGPQRRAVSG